MVPSITFKDVEDKRAFYHNVLAPERSAQNQWLKDWNGDGSRDWRDLAFAKEGLYRIEDTNGDGVADKSTLMLEDFNDLVSDTFHDILWYKGDLYVTVSPDLWRLRDTNGDGVIDTKESLSHGSGVHIGFGGHGHSGPLIGPDGRIYWKQGDLGVHITTREGRELVQPEQRRHPARESRRHRRGDLRQRPAQPAGLRVRRVRQHRSAPTTTATIRRELERLVYIVDGMDSGWRINWQFGKYVDPDNNNYKVWMDEGMWKPRWNGPGGVLHATHRVVALRSGRIRITTRAPRSATRGRVGSSTPCSSAHRRCPRIQAFKLAPQGAGFRLDKDTAVVRGGILATGVKFGPDGSALSRRLDRGLGAEGPRPDLDARRSRGGGEPGARRGEGAHRRRLQVALAWPISSACSVTPTCAFARRRSSSSSIATQPPSCSPPRGRTSNQLARIHGMWGLHQLALKDARQARAARRVPQGRRRGDPRPGSEAARRRALRAAARRSTSRCCKDASPRVRFFAAQALGRIAYEPAVQPIVEMLAANNDEDVYLRHAGALALSRIGPAEQIAALSSNPNRGVRIAAVVALRRMKDPSVARFLADQDEFIVTEAARAINDDGGIEGALPALAAALDGKVANEPFVRRAINANLRVGTPEAAKRVAAYASRTDATDELRVEAVADARRLAEAVDPRSRRRLLARPGAARHGQGGRRRDARHRRARAALASIVTPLFGNASTALQVALADAVGRLRVTDAATLMYDKARTGSAPEVRIAALRALGQLGDSRTAEAVRAALADQEATVRMAALSGIAPLKLPDATTAQLLSSVIVQGHAWRSSRTRLTALGRVQGTSGREELTRLVDQLAQGKVAPEIQLDVAEAARATKDPELDREARRRSRSRAPGSRRRSRTPTPCMAATHDAARASSSRARRRSARAATTSASVPGANVGPPLRGVASRLTREQLLEALVDPSARIAPGYGPVQVTLKNGQKYFGTLKEETDSYIVVDVSPAPKKIAKSDIAQRTNGPSPMPPMPTLLSRREIRDVVEYLSTLK